MNEIVTSVSTGLLVIALIGCLGYLFSLVFRQLSIFFKESLRFAVSRYLIIASMLMGSSYLIGTSTIFLFNKLV